MRSNKVYTIEKKCFICDLNLTELEYLMSNNLNEPCCINHSKNVTKTESQEPII